MRAEKVVAKEAEAEQQRFRYKVSLHLVGNEVDRFETARTVRRGKSDQQ